jgi:hypothetical protein
MYGTHTLAFQRIFVRMKIISLISIRFSYVSLISNSVTGPLNREATRQSQAFFDTSIDDFEIISFRANSDELLTRENLLLSKFKPFLKYPNSQ